MNIKLLQQLLHKRMYVWQNNIKHTFGGVIEDGAATIKALKGVSARLLFKEFPLLKKKLWGGYLWNPSYFVATVSEHTEEQIRKTFSVTYTVPF